MRHTLGALFLLLVASAAQAQTLPKAQVDKILEKAKADIDALATPAAATVVTSNLQAAINKAPVGAALTFAYLEPAEITLPKAVTLKGTGSAAIQGGVNIPGDNVTIDGVLVTAPPSRNDVLVMEGAATKLLNVTVVGATTGQKRGIAGNAKGFYFSHVTVTGFQLAGQDAQAFACWDNCQDGLIEDSTFSGAGETFLVGGSDHQAADRMPRNLTVRRSRLTKDLAWRRVGPQVKNTLELKCIDGFTIEDSVIENSWQDAQDGYLILVSPRNQDGANPWCGVQNVTIQRNTGGHAAALLLVAGDDDKFPSQRTTNVRVIDNAFVDLAPSIWRAGGQWGSGFMILILRGPTSFTFERNTLAGGPPLAPFDGKQTGSVVYFDASAVKCGVCNINGNTWMTSQYGVFGPNAAPGPDAWKTFIEAGTVSGNVEH